MKCNKCGQMKIQCHLSPNLENGEYQLNHIDSGIPASSQVDLVFVWDLVNPETELYESIF